MRDLVFVLWDNLNAGSTKVKGIQPAEYFGADYITHSNMDYQNTKDKIIVFVGGLTAAFNLTADKILDLQSKNNIVLVDPVDSLCYQNPWGDNIASNENEYLCLTVVDGIFTPNSKSLDNFNGIVKNSCFLQNLPHNLDEHFYSIEQPKNTEFTIGYGGSIYDNEFFVNKPVDYLDINGQGHTDDVVRFCKKHTCHFSHRKSDTIDFMLKPASKVIVASVCESPIVCSRDWSNLDLLPDDYPLYVNDDKEDVVDKIEYAKSIFGTPKWKELLDIGKNIVERTSLPGLESMYTEVFKHFDWKSV